MTSVFTIKRDDTAPSLIYTLTPVVDLTGADVVFNMRAEGGSTAVISRAPAVIVTAASGIVRYDWEPGDTASDGRFEAEFEVTLPDGSVATYPNSGFIGVRIAEDIA